jgi:peroxiredoxin family protein
MNEVKGPLLLLCHSAAWERLYQAFSAAASASSAGQEVVLVFYFGALTKLVEGKLDEYSGGLMEGAAQRLRERAQEAGTTPPSALLQTARRTGRARLLACSASVVLEGHERSEVAALVDDIVGWPTVNSIMARASQVLYI